MAAGRSAKRFIKRGVKRFGMLAGRPFRMTGSRILTYHSVGERDHEMNVRPGDFRAQMAWLSEHCEVVPLPAALEGDGGVAVTFDDGYRDNLLNAAPVLKELSIPATFFVVAGCLGGMLDHDSDPVTSVLMTWEEVAELEGMGFSIGAHTLSHRRLCSLGEDEQHAEIEGSKQLLEEHLGHAVEAFAYPFGSSADYDDTSERLVRECGFAYAVSNRYGVNGPDADRWTLRRIWIDATDDLRMFRAKVDGRLDVLSALDSQLGVRARRALNRLLQVR